MKNLRKPIIKDQIYLQQQISVYLLKDRFSANSSMKLSDLLYLH